MKTFLILTLISVLAVSIEAQIVGGYTDIPFNDPKAMEAKKVVLLELEKEAKKQPGGPKVEITVLSARKQVVAGTNVELTYKAVFLTSDGKENTKSCKSVVFFPLPQAKPSDPKVVEHKCQ